MTELVSQAASQAVDGGPARLTCGPVSVCR
jgi:hypothetical protein